MTEQEILYYNKLIAKFMGDYKGLYWSDINEFYLNENGQMAMLTNRCGRWNSSWDWIMDVVIKINTMEDFRYSTKILTMDVEIEDSHTLKIVAESSLDFNPDELLKSVYQCVVKFIEWYNKNN